MDWRLENRESFYDTLVEWWKAWEFPVLSKEMIPNRIFVVFDKETQTDLYALPVYITDTKLCWIGFPTSNRQASKEMKKGALEYILEVMTHTLKYEGFKMIMTTSGTPKLMGEFLNSGFEETEQGVNYYIKLL